MYDANQLSRRGFIKGMAVTGAGLAVASSFPGLLHAAEPRPGGVLRVSVSRELKTLNPLKHVNLSEYLQGEMMYSGLVKLDRGLQPIPDLAEKWESPDAKTWYFTLRKGATFQNGKDVTADDVVATIQAILSPDTASPGRKNIGPITEVKADGPQTVKIVTEYPFSFLPQSLAYPCMKICPAEALSSGSFDAQVAKGVGSGPFKLREYVPGTHVILERNPNYFEPGKPYLNEVHLVIFPESIAEINALLTGQIDVALEANLSQIGRLQKSPDITVTRTGSGQFPNTVFGCDSAPFNDPRVRKALALSLDREMALDMCVEGYGRIANDCGVSPEYPFYHAMPQRKQDLEGAARLLREAGVKKGATIPLYISDVPAVRGKLGIVIQQCAQMVGLNVKLQQVDYSTFLDQYWKKANYYVGFYNMQSCEDALFQLLYTSNAAWNETRWNNAKFDQLVLQARQELDPDKQRAIFASCQELMHEEVPSCIPLFLDLLSAHRNNVQGYDRHPRNTFSFFENVWKS